MKKIFICFLCLGTFYTFAASVKVTSFSTIRIAGDIFHPVAELCGLVENATSHPSFVRVVVDPNSNRPGVYNTVAGEDGKFCLTVITHRGSAKLNLFGESSSTLAQIR